MNRIVRRTVPTQNTHMPPSNGSLLSGTALAPRGRKSSEPLEHFQSEGCPAEAIALEPHCWSSLDGADWRGHTLRRP